MSALNLVLLLGVAFTSAAIPDPASLLDQARQAMNVEESFKGGPAFAPVYPILTYGPQFDLLTEGFG